MKEQNSGRNAETTSSEFLEIVYHSERKIMFKKKREQSSAARKLDGHETGNDMEYIVVTQA